MLMMLLAGFLVVFPAIAVILYFIDRPMWILPAIASLAINSLPFLVAILLIRAQRDKGEEMDAH
jgi:hypothetical protein